MLGDPNVFAVALDRIALVDVGDDDKVPQVIADCVDWLRENNAFATEVCWCHWCIVTPFVLRRDCLEFPVQLKTFNAYMTCTNKGKRVDVSRVRSSCRSAIARGGLSEAAKAYSVHTVANLIKV
jgi:uncharacterized membrane-anchored protein